MLREPIVYHAHSVFYKHIPSRCALAHLPWLLLYLCLSLFPTVNVWVGIEWISFVCIFVSVICTNRIRTTDSNTARCVASCVCMIELLFFSRFSSSSSSSSSSSIRLTLALATYPPLSFVRSLARSVGRLLVHFDIFRLVYMCFMQSIYIYNSAIYRSVRSILFLSLLLDCMYVCVCVCERACGCFVYVVASERDSIA